MTETILWIPGILWAVTWGLMAFGAVLTLWHWHKARVSPIKPKAALDPVTILKPIKGLDPDLKENLRSFFELRYPQFEVLLSVAESDDPAVPVIQDLMAEYPDVDAQLLIGDEPVGRNPKVRNLVRSYKQAKYDWLYISDSNIRIENGQLSHMMSQADSKTGVLASLISGIEPESWGGRLEAIHLNTFYSRATQLAFFFKHPVVVGKSMLFRRSVADRFGGLASLSHYIAEDYMFGRAIQHLGYQVKLVSWPVRQVLGNHGIQGFWSRHLRWGRIRKSQNLPSLLAEPLIANLFLSALFGAFVMPSLLDLTLGQFLSFHFLSWLCIDLIQTRCLSGRVSLLHVADWLLREALSLPLWCHTILGRTVTWRGTKYRLSKQGVLIDPKSP